MTNLLQATHGFRLVASILAEQSRQGVRELRPEWFVGDGEIALHEFLMQFYRRHGGLPTLDIMTEHGFNLDPNPGPLSYNLDRCRDRALYTILLDQFGELQDAIRDQKMTEAVDIIRSLNVQCSGLQGANDLTSMANMVDLVMEDYETARGSADLRGISLRWPMLNHYTAGIQPGDVMVVVARMGVGKSYAMIELALDAWRQGNKVLFFTMEMTVLQIARRTLGVEAKINPDTLRRGQVDSWAYEEVQQAGDRIKTAAPFYLVSGDMRKSVSQVDAFIQELNPDVIYIDAGYLLKPDKKHSSRWEALADVGEEIKAMGLRRNRPIVMSVQFNREASKKRKGRYANHGLEMVGGTDVLSQIASLVLGMQEGLAPKPDKTRIMTLHKNRDGPACEFVTDFLFDRWSMAENPEELKRLIAKKASKNPADAGSKDMSGMA